MDPARRVIENGAVAISGDHIVEAGPRAEIDRKYTAATGWTGPTPSSLPG